MTEPKYDAKEAERMLLEYVIPKVRPGEKAAAAARALVNEFAALCDRIGGIKARAQSGSTILVVTAPQGSGGGVALDVDEHTGDIVFLRGTSVLDRLEGVRFNPSTGMLEGLEEDAASSELAYRKPKRSALAVLTEAILKRLAR